MQHWLNFSTMHSIQHCSVIVAKITVTLSSNVHGEQVIPICQFKNLLYSGTFPQSTWPLCKKFMFVSLAFMKIVMLDGYCTSSYHSYVEPP